ncbi:hypothetical protein F4781DRAFT_429260 [Annulohypoxylon bovei var. microspora]|nr:hypothetical protein F4781DRAFT_429260 [Annulohypoxylon bovei var. microspora]
MRFSTFLSVITAPLMALAAPNCVKRQGTSQFCTRITPAPPQEVTDARFNEFAYLFLVKKDIYAAFTYILPEYINHNPAVQNGAQNALNFLGSILGNQTFTVLRTKIEGDMSWLNYQSSFGTIVDRFRWEDGCIIEHWDENETFPAS